MIVKKEKIYKKSDGIMVNTIKSESWWLFGIIPLYIRREIINRESYLKKFL